MSAHKPLRGFVKSGTITVLDTIQQVLDLLKAKTPSSASEDNDASVNTTTSTTVPQARSRRAVGRP